MPQAPNPGPGEVTVRLRAVGICGSDMHWYLEGSIGQTPAAYPQILGHEPAGDIVALGSGVEGFALGERVAIEPSITCGECEMCRVGRHNCCLTSIFMGSPQYHGLFREYATVPARNLDKVPQTMSYSQITVIEPLAVIHHILEMVQIRVGDTVAIMGGGSIGMLAAAMAKVSGASRVFVADKTPHRLELARKMGADDAVDIAQARDYILDETRGRGVDVVIDAAGKAQTMQTGIAVAKTGGKLVLVGIPSENPLGVDMNAAMNKELFIQTIKRSNHNAHEAIELLGSGRISDAFVTHRLPFAETARGFDMLADYTDNVGKVVIEL